MKDQTKFIITRSLLSAFLMIVFCWLILMPLTWWMIKPEYRTVEIWIETKAPQVVTFGLVFIFPLMYLVGAGIHRSNYNFYQRMLNLYRAFPIGSEFWAHNSQRTLVYPELVLHGRIMGFAKPKLFLSNYDVTWFDFANEKEVKNTFYLQYILFETREKLVAYVEKIHAEKLADTMQEVDELAEYCEKIENAVREMK